MARVLCPLPDVDFDTTEVAVPWHVLTRAGHEVVFATERTGVVPACDPLLISGVLFGQLGAHPDAKALYAQMIETAPIRSPISWGTLDVSAYDALLLPGGHAPGMRQYLGSAKLHEQIAAFWALGRPVAAICHGVLVLARSHGADGKSVLAGSKTTCLPKYMERTAYYLTGWKLGSYYRTYPAYVEDEVKGALGNADVQFVRGPRTLTDRDRDDDDRAGFVVEDGRYVSARWPGDAWTFAKALLRRL
jgi:putative intracellular protease/amidase